MFFPYFVQDIYKLSLVLSFLVEIFGNLFIMIRSLLLMIYKINNTLNVRGIRPFDKRKALFHWCMKDKAK